MKRRHSKITWTVAPTAVQPVKFRNHERLEDVPIPFQEYFVPGAAWIVIRKLNHVTIDVNTVKPPHPVLTTRRGNTAFVPGTLAMYVGQIRVSEQGRKKTLSVLHHVFIVGTGQYIIPDISCLVPSDEFQKDANESQSAAPAPL